MKKNTLFIILIFCFNSSLYSQDFLEEGKTWFYEYYYADGGDWTSTPETRIETIKVGGDTIINDTVYSILNISYNQSCLVTYYTANPITGGYLGKEYLREEDGKIYRYYEGEDIEYLLIDFNATEDHLTSCYISTNNWSAATLNVEFDSITTLTSYDGTELELRYVTIPDNWTSTQELQYLILENVGYVSRNSIRHLIENLGPFSFESTLFPELYSGLCDGYDRINNLRCVTVGTDTIRFSELGCTEIDITDPTVNIREDGFLISPNPSRGIIQIEIPEKLKTGKLSIMDLSGRLIFQVEKWNNPNLDLSHLDNGIYFLVLEDKERQQLFREKLVLMK